MMIIRSILAILLNVIGIENAHANKEEYGDIKGMLVSEDQSPVKDERVFLVPEHRILRYGIHTKTDGSGRFTFDKVPIGQYAIAYGPFSSQGQWITVRFNNPTDLVLKLNTSHVQSLAGTISTADSPITAGVVSFILLSPDPSRLVWPPPIAMAEIAKDGQYRIDAIQPGRYLVHVRPLFPVPGVVLQGLNSLALKDKKKPTPDSPQTANFVEFVEIKPGQRKLDFPIPQSGLEGTVISPNGKPASNLMLFLSPVEVQSGWVPHEMSAFAGTDEQGKFCFPHVSPGTYDVLIGDSKVYPPRFGIQLMKNVQVTSERASISFQLTKLFTAQAFISFSGESIPEWSYTMAISEDYPKLRSLSDQVFYSHDGESFQPVCLRFPKGNYKVLTMAKQLGYSCEALSMTLHENLEVCSKLVPACAIRVVLKGEAKNISGRSIKLLDDSGNLVPRLYNPLWSYDFDLLPAVVLPTCLNGVTMIGSLRPGRYTLIVDGTDAKAEITVLAGETVTACIHL